MKWGLSVRIDPPCHGCVERRLGCHTDCEKYRAYRAQQEVVYRLRASYGGTASNPSLTKAMYQRLREEIKRTRR